MAQLLKTLILSAVIVFTVGVNFAFALPDIVTLQGMCDASAVIKVGSQFLVLNDEDKTETVFRFFDFTTGGTPSLVAKLPTEKLQIDPSHPEIDFEGLTQIQDVYFAIGSHSRSSDLPYAPRDSRKNLIAFRWQPETTQPIKVIGSLKALIPALQSHLMTTPSLKITEIDPARDPKQEDGGGGLSIEGLAAMPNGNLLIGLRSPTNPSVGALTSRQAIAIELVNPLKAITDNQATLGNVYLWQLDGAGIRDLAYDPVKHRIVILSGPPGPGKPFKIWTWNGDAAQPTQVLNLSKDKSMTEILDEGGAPEGLTVDGKHLWFVFDEGKRKVHKHGPDKLCGKLSPSDSEKTFRAMPIPYNF